MSDPIHLLGLSGSIRRDSYCTAILRTLAGMLPEGVALTIFGLEHIPPYNEDEEETPPGVVAALRKAVTQADGLVVISPEYNHGMSGVLKNAIDWVSRPGYSSILKDKPVSVMTAAPSMLGGARAQMQLRETFASTVSRVMAHRQVCIGNVAKKVTDGVLTDQPTIDFALGAIDILLNEVRLLRLAAKGTHKEA
jgi:chromate reductase, NAD(P)H dehydrogenase (quinone)